MIHQTHVTPNANPLANITAAHVCVKFIFSICGRRKTTLTRFTQLLASQVEKKVDDNRVFNINGGMTSNRVIKNAHEEELIMKSQKIRGGEFCII